MTLLALLCAGQSYAQKALAATEIWDRLQKTFANANSVECEFTYSQTQPLHSFITTYHVVLQRPNKSRAWYSSNGKTPIDVVTDGTTTWMYFRATKMFLKNGSNGENYGFPLPLGLSLYRRQPVGGTYRLASEKVSKVIFKGEHTLAIQLVHDDRNGKQLSEDNWLYLNPRSYMPVGSMRIQHAEDRMTTVVTFAALKIDPTVSPTQFTFALPKDAIPYRDTDPIAVGNDAPTFTATTQDGRESSLTDLLRDHKALLLNFWSYG